MKAVKNFIENQITSFRSEFRNEKAVNFFCKGVYVYLLIKILFTWSFISLLTEVYYYPPSGSLAGKAVFFLHPWASQHIHWFLGISVAAVTLAVFLPLNYITAIVVLFIGINFYRFHYPVANGSDLVLNVLLLLAIPLSSRLRSSNDSIRFVQVVAYNFFLIFCQLQIGMIYLVSGVDKLQSAAWKSGEAIAILPKLTLMFNPGAKYLIPENQTVLMIAGWLVILFELSFPVLVWWRKTRLATLAIGVIFHLLIWLTLNLPDFGLIMIVSYLIFLKDEDYKYIRVKIRR